MPENKQQEKDLEINPDTTHHQNDQTKNQTPSSIRDEQSRSTESQTNPQAQNILSTESDTAHQTNSSSERTPENSSEYSELKKEVESTHNENSEQQMGHPGRPRPRGTAAMDPETRQEVARKGGLAVSRNKQHMAEIGRKGGQTVSKNREHMAKIGRKGGAASRGHKTHGENQG